MQYLPTLNIPNKSTDIPNKSTDIPNKSTDIIEHMAKIEGKYWGYAPLTLGILAGTGCIAGGMGMFLGRGDIFKYAFPPGLVFIIVAIIWDRSRYSLMVLKVISKQKHAKTIASVNYGDGDYSTSESVVFEYWLSTDLGCTKIDKQLYDQFEKGSKYEVIAQIMDGDLFVSGFPRKPKLVR